MQLAERVKSFFRQHIPVLVARKQNVLLIQVYPKKNVIFVSYKGRVETGYFTDKTLHNMVTGVRFRQNTEEFLAALATLLNKLINN